MAMRRCEMVKWVIVKGAARVKYRSDDASRYDLMYILMLMKFAMQNVTAADRIVHIAQSKTSR